MHRLTPHLRPHYGAISTLCVRDAALVIASGLLMCALCWYVGHPGPALAVAFAICLIETALQVLFRHTGPFAGLTKDQRALSALFLQGLYVIVYNIPVFYLASDPSIAMKVTGLMFVIGAQIYITNTWLRVPIFLYVMLIPTMAMLALAFYSLTTTAPIAASAIDWTIASIVLVVFLYSFIDTLRQHVIVQNDLTAAQKDASARLSQLEETHRLDGLTGVLNRPAFDVALHVMLQDRALSGGEITVFLLDMDNFKPINDTYTHEAGDAVLTQTARRIETFVGASGIVGRLGGDEFVCAVPDLDTSAAVLEYGTKLSQALSKPIHWNTRTFKTSASIGAATTVDSTLNTVASLCSAADQAMFAAKSAPHSAPVLFRPEAFRPRMTPQDKQHLIAALSDHSVKPYYQPKIDLPSGKIIGFEALVRWEFSKDDLRQPEDFIDQINELGLQGDFMMSLASQVIKDTAAFLRAGHDPGQVSLNLSEVALATHSGREDLRQIILAYPDAAKHLTFEITEDVFIARAAETIQASIASFRDLGVRVSLDDFGTGFASFHHLRQLDFDELKIDTTFIADLGHDPDAKVLVRGFLDIASGIGVNVVAEGVETPAQSRDLIDMGCTTAQGFLFSPAVPFEDAVTLLRNQAT